ncbi:MAG: hypothetical protein M3P89_06245 [Actinomycetota bacterium]|nr:hypothetical protein [Actinomycetota bacterium]
MDLNEAAERIFKYHWVLILLLTLLGLSIPVGLAQLQDDAYVASARIFMGAADAKDSEEANSLADTALGVATSPGVLSKALMTAGVQRDQAELTTLVRVEPVGTSGILQLSVTDPDPEVSAQLATALATEVVARRTESVLGKTEQLLAQTDVQIGALAQNITGIEAEADAAAREQARLRAIGLEGGAPLDALELRHSQAVEQLNNLQTQRQELAATLASTVRPEVVDASASRGIPVETSLAARVAAGGLLGLILGIALAATLEAWRPTLGPAALARHLGVPLLGRLRRLPQTAGDLSDQWLAGYVSLAADNAGVRSFELVPVGPSVDVTGLARSLAAETEVGTDIVPLTLDGPHTSRLPAAGTQPDTGIVVVAPKRVKAAWLSNLERHVHLTRQPVIGLIAYTGSGGPVRKKQAAAAAATPKPATS